MAVDMASITKAERYTSDSDGGGEEGSRQAPTKSLGAVEELFARYDVPADLEMHRDDADKNCRNMISGRSIESKLG